MDSGEGGGEGEWVSRPSPSPAVPSTTRCTSGRPACVCPTTVSSIAPGPSTRRPHPRRPLSGPRPAPTPYSSRPRGVPVRPAWYRVCIKRSVIYYPNVGDCLTSTNRNHLKSRCSFCCFDRPCFLYRCYYFYRYCCRHGTSDPVPSGVRSAGPDVTGGRGGVGGDRCECPLGPSPTATRISTPPTTATTDVCRPAPAVEVRGRGGAGPGSRRGGAGRDGYSRVAFGGPTGTRTRPTVRPTATTPTTPSTRTTLSGTTTSFGRLPSPVSFRGPGVWTQGRLEPAAMCVAPGPGVGASGPVGTRGARRRGTHPGTTVYSDPT